MISEKMHLEVSQCALEAYEEDMAGLAAFLQTLEVCSVLTATVSDFSFLLDGLACYCCFSLSFVLGCN